jgi:hypothetical protein
VEFPSAYFCYFFKVAPQYQIKQWIVFFGFFGNGQISRCHLLMKLFPLSNCKRLVHKERGTWNTPSPINFTCKDAWANPQETCLTKQAIHSLYTNWIGSICTPIELDELSVLF